MKQMKSSHLKTFLKTYTERYPPGRKNPIGLDWTRGFTPPLFGKRRKTVKNCKIIRKNLDDRRFCGCGYPEGRQSTESPRSNPTASASVHRCQTGTCKTLVFCDHQLTATESSGSLAKIGPVAHCTELLDPLFHSFLSAFGYGTKINVQSV